MTLRKRIIIYVSIIIFLSSLIGIALSTALLFAQTRSGLERVLMNTAETLSKLPFVAEELKTRNYNGRIQAYTQEILRKTEWIEAITVSNMEGLRFSHNNPNNLGKPTAGGDDLLVRGGVTYISEAVGTMGDTIRAFVPVFDESGVQVGYAIGVTTLKTLRQLYMRNVWNSLLFLACGLAVGVAGAVIVSGKIKRILLNFEPEEIARLYREHWGLTHAIHEGVIAIDANGNISLANESALRLLGMEGENLVSRHILSVMPGSRLPRVLATGQAEFDWEETLDDNTHIISNRVPVRQGDRIVGAVETFRDLTAVAQLSEELTGVKELVEVMRARAHEFKNLRQIVLGLIDLREYDRAKQFVLNTDNFQDRQTSFIASRFKEPVIAGLLLGKLTQSRELGIKLEVTPESRLGLLGSTVRLHAYVTIIGNLVSNALEALDSRHSEDKRVTVGIVQGDDGCRIEVADNGPGISKDDAPRIFDRGYTTRRRGSGIGLALVKSAAATLGGDIRLDSTPFASTAFTVVIPPTPARGKGDNGETG